MKRSSYSRFHGGPEVQTPVKKHSARRRGLKPSGEPYRLSKARVVMRDGIVLDPKRFAQINPTRPLLALDEARNQPKVEPGGCGRIPISVTARIGEATRK